MQTTITGTLISQCFFTLRVRIASLCCIGTLYPADGLDFSRGGTGPAGGPRIPGLGWLDSRVLVLFVDPHLIHFSLNKTRQTGYFPLENEKDVFSFTKHLAHV